MPEPMTSPPAPAAPRWMKLALAVSLALNLGVLGLVAGAVMRDGPSGRVAMVRDLNFGPMGEALTREDRATLRRAFLQANPGFRDERARMAADMAGLLVALRADPFDPAALEAALAAQAGRMTGRIEAGQALLAAHVVAMPPADRLAFADRLERAMRRGDHERGDHEKGDHGRRDGGTQGQGGG